MRNIPPVALLAALMLIAGFPRAEESHQSLLFQAPIADFYLVGQECKTMLGSLNDPEWGVNTVPYDFPTVFVHACKRDSMSISCLLESATGEGSVKGKAFRIEMKVLLDIAPDLFFGTDNGSEFVAARPSKNAFVLTNRSGVDDGAGSKVCAGYYLTGQEVQLMRDGAPELLRKIWPY